MYDMVLNVPNKLYETASLCKAKTACILPQMFVFSPYLSETGTAFEKKNCVKGTDSFLPLLLYVPLVSLIVY